MIARSVSCRASWLSLVSVSYPSQLFVQPPRTIGPLGLIHLHRLSTPLIHIHGLISLALTYYRSSLPSLPLLIPQHLPHLLSCSLLLP